MFPYLWVLDRRFKLNSLPKNYRHTQIDRVVTEIMDFDYEMPIANADGPYTVQAETSDSSRYWNCFNKTEPTNQRRTGIILRYKKRASSVLIRENCCAQRKSITLVDTNNFKYPHLCKLAKKYLSTPASTVISERLFPTKDLVNALITRKRKNVDVYKS